MVDILDHKQGVKEFLTLLSSRLEHKHKEHSGIISKLLHLRDNFTVLPKSIDLKTIDNICKKAYYDFEMDKSYDLKLGYTEDERNNIRTLILNILRQFCEMGEV